MMAYEIKFIPSAQKDFQKFEGRRKILVAKQLAKLETNPFTGQHLGKKVGIDLSGYYKLYAAKKENSHHLFHSGKSHHCKKHHYW